MSAKYLCISVRISSENLWYSVALKFLNVQQNFYWNAFEYLWCLFISLVLKWVNYLENISEMPSDYSHLIIFFTDAKQKFQKILIYNYIQKNIITL